MVRFYRMNDGFSRNKWYVFTEHMVHFVECMVHFTECMIPFHGMYDTFS